MTHRGPFQPLLFCDSVIPLPREEFQARLRRIAESRRGALRVAADGVFHLGAPVAADPVSVDIGTLSLTPDVEPAAKGTRKTEKEEKRWVPAAGRRLSTSQAGQQRCKERGTPFPANHPPQAAPNLPPAPRREGIFSVASSQGCPQPPAGIGTTQIHGAWSECFSSSKKRGV